jgi:hypothetical protein
MTNLHPPASGAESRSSVKLHSRYLRAYLSDHLAVSEGIGALAQRVCDASRWQGQRTSFEILVDVLGQDREDLERVLADRGIAQDPLKRRLARMGERVGRLKGNGRMVRTSPLTRLVELEGLQLGLSACITPWVTLRDLGVERSRAEAAIVRLAHQQEMLDRLRATVAPTAFAD